MRRTRLKRVSDKKRRPSKHVALLNEARSRYDELVDAQATAMGWPLGTERCAICLAAPKSRKLNIDHDHRLIQVRGLLCQRDNRILHAWVTPAWLRAALW